MQDYTSEQFAVDGAYGNLSHDTHMWDDEEHNVIAGTTILGGPITPLPHEHSSYAEGTNLFLFD